MYYSGPIACSLALSALLAAGCATVVPNCGCLLNPAHTGCHPQEVHTDYLLVEGRASASLEAPVGVEVRSTPAYLGIRSAVTTAAVRPPDECASESAVQVTGQATHTDKIASTDCGVWMAELERTLSQAGLRVVSWDAVRGSIRSKSLTAHEAARELGAEVLFLFNSAEASFIGPDSASERKADFYHADEYGKKGAPYSLSNNEATAVRNAVAAKLDSWVATQAKSGIRALSATLDATAVLTATGEAAWFYRNTAIRQLSNADGEAYLFVRTPAGWRFAQRKTVETQAVPVVPAETSASGFVETVRTEGSRDTYKVERLALFRRVAEAFVTSFRNGEGAE